jgi:hypothetical protein
MPSIRGRRGFGPRSLRAPLGGSRPAPVAPGAPTISASGGAIVIGGTLTIAAGTPIGNPVGTYVLYRGGVSAGAVVSGYVFTADDIGPTIEVTATNVVGESAVSNTLRFAYTDLDTTGAAWVIFADAGTTLVSGTHVSAQDDLSASPLADITQTTDALRPLTGVLIGGQPAVGYTGSVPSWLGEAGPTGTTALGTSTPYIIAAVDITNNTTAADASTFYTGDTILGLVGNSLKLCLYVDTGVKKAAFATYGGVLLTAAQATVTDGFHIIRGYKVGTTASVVVDGGTPGTQTVDALISSMGNQLRIGFTAGSTRGFNGKLGALLCWHAAPSDAIRDTVEAFLRWYFVAL